MLCIALELPMLVEWGGPVPGWHLYKAQRGSRIRPEGDKHYADVHITVCSVFQEDDLAAAAFFR
jgi:hypothetical protein